jgi:hypothetical protein
VLVGTSPSSSFFTGHTSPTSYFLCGSLRNRIISFDDGAHHAILWNGIHWTMFSIPFFSKWNSNGGTWHSTNLIDHVSIFSKVPKCWLLPPNGGCEDQDFFPPPSQAEKKDISTMNKNCLLNIPFFFAWNYLPTGSDITLFVFMKSPNDHQEISHCFSLHEIVWKPLSNIVFFFYMTSISGH